MDANDIYLFRRYPQLRQRFSYRRERAADDDTLLHLELRRRRADFRTDESSNTWTTTTTMHTSGGLRLRPIHQRETALTYSISPSAWSTQSTLNFNSTTSTADTLTTLDSQGRPHVTQQRQSQGSSNDLGRNRLRSAVPDRDGDNSLQWDRWPGPRR